MLLLVQKERFFNASGLYEKGSADIGSTLVMESQGIPSERFREVGPFNRKWVLT